MMAEVVPMNNTHHRLAFHPFTVVTTFANRGQMSSVAASFCSVVNPAVVSFSIVVWYPLHEVLTRHPLYK